MLAVVGKFMRYNFELVKHYKFEIIFITFVIMVSGAVILINEIMNTKAAYSSDYFWMPSAIMQSVAAIYALFVAIFVLSIQNNQRTTILLGDEFKPRFKTVSAIVATTIYFNGFVLFIFSHYEHIDLEVNILYYSSLFSLLVSLIAIVYFSSRMISAIGLNTYNEISYNLSHSKNIEEYSKNREECYKSLIAYIDIEGPNNHILWSVKPEDEKKIITKYFKLLLEHGNSHMKYIIAGFIENIRDTRCGDQLIKNLNDSDKNVIASSARALGVRGYVIAVKPLMEKLNDKSLSVRQSSLEALGTIGDLRAVDPLIKMLDDQDENVIVSSELALGKIRDIKAVEPLIKKLDDRRDRVREFAVDALGMTGDPRAIEPIKERLHDNNINVRNRAETALKEIQ